jgi:hypothetical protein
MADRPLNHMLRYVQRVVRTDGASVSDQDLLQRSVRSRSGSQAGALGAAGNPRDIDGC